MFGTQTESRLHTGVVDGEGEVATDGYDGNVGTEAEADTGGDALGQILEAELAPGELFRLVDEPDVAGIGKESTFEDGNDRESVFEVGHELYVSDAFESVFGGGLESSWTEVAQVPGANCSGAAAEEAFLVRHRLRVAVREADAHDDTSHESAFCSHVEIAFQLGIQFDILGEGDTEDLHDAVLVGIVA